MGLGTTKRISIIWRITIWYTVFMIALSLIILGVTYQLSGRILQNSTKDLLMEWVETAAEDVEYEDGELDFDEVMDALDRGVYLVLYDREGRELEGLSPKNFVERVEFDSGEFRTIKQQENEWLVYDLEENVPGYGNVVVRGILPSNAAIDGLAITTSIILKILPILIIVAVAGGYWLTRGALRPLNQMRMTIEQISVGKDLTKRVNLGKGEDELHRLGRTFDQMFERLEQSFEREKQFTSDVSHELRTPVSVILSQCEYAMEQENGQDTAEALQSIYHQTKRMSKMISQLLLLSRAERGFETLQIESVNLSEIMELVVEEIEEKAETKNIQVESKIEPNLILEGDETLLMRLCMNLLENAVKYGKVDGKIEVDLHGDETQIFGEIKDNGIGIAKENQGKIWQRFYQVQPSRTSNVDGNLGLGLSMVSWIVQAHQGTIGVESELGEGSRFYFTLNRKKS